MSDASVVEVVEFGDRTAPGRVLERLLAPDGPPFVLVRHQTITISSRQIEALVRACLAPMAASASPVPSAEASPTEVSDVPLHDRLPPPPTIALPSTSVSLFLRDAVQSVFVPDDVSARSVDAVLLALARRQVDAGWRHVAAPGSALDWMSADDAPGFAAGGWSAAAVREIDGEANEGLATHRLWARVASTGPRVVVDGACLTDQPHNGSQELVLEVATWLQRTRPRAEVTLAVPEQYVEHFTTVLAADDLRVVARRSLDARFDLAYRPYQLIDPTEVEWLVDAGERMLMGQLDMIAFSNPSYHPSPGLLHAVRNLQRRMMRIADGVTFISRFGLETARAECPDLAASRLFVVSCGADPRVVETDEPAEQLRDLDGFVVCLSATFWHKNRQHALRVFAELCATHGYGGSLVIAGPEPYHGSSTEAERAITDAFPSSLEDRVVRVGRIDEGTKWELLRRADVVLYPSVVEGFGLVPFEAAAVGTPTLAHAGSALREVLGDAGCLVPSWDVGTWAATAARLIHDEAAAADVVDAIRAVARTHTWHDVATSTWEAIDATLAGPRRMPPAEEGVLRSRISPRAGAIAHDANIRHFVQRSIAHVQHRRRQHRA